jgi:hypothetical protein
MKTAPGTEVSLRTLVLAERTGGRVGMFSSRWLLLWASVATVGCATVGSNAPPSLTPAESAAVEDAVRSFMARVARDVTQNGPAAWGNVFVDGPSFFMAVDGQLVFPSGAAAIAALPELSRTIQHIELVWGEDLRVDPLTSSLAVVATSWHEVRVDGAGHRVDEKGFFTATAEYREGRWQFRNAHWSDPRSTAP